ncbi:MAG: hypothetical protein ACOX4U_03600 [Anaerovoracaceae bacterium]|jgi:hypothetical protein
MKTFINNWDLKRHIAAETMFYTSLGIIGNAFFKKNEESEEKNSCIIGKCSAMPRKQKMFNGILLSCFTLDLVAGYCLLKGLKRIIK